jgi:hypothetical protein
MNGRGSTGSARICNCNSACNSETHRLSLDLNARNMDGLAWIWDGIASENMKEHELSDSISAVNVVETLHISRVWSSFPTL